MQPSAKLTIDQALHNIKLVIEQFRGTYQEHQTLQISFQIVTEHVKALTIKVDEKDIDKSPLK